MRHLLVLLSLAACAPGSAQAQSVPPRAAPTAPLPLPFVATGNEPGWRLDIAAEAITLIADYGATKLSMRGRPPEPVAGGRRYAGNADGRVLVVTVLDHPCVDDMTGMPRPNTVTVTLDEDALRGCGGNPATLLRGAPWVVDDIGGAGLVEGSQATITFGDDGRVTGSASCNGYTAGYSLSAEALRIERAVATRKACAPALMTQEQALLDVLSAVMRFEVAGDGALVLHATDGRTVRARR